MRFVWVTSTGSGVHGVRSSPLMRCAPGSTIFLWWVCVCVCLCSPGPSWFKQAASPGRLPPGWDPRRRGPGPDPSQIHGLLRVLLRRGPVLLHAVMPGGGRCAHPLHQFPPLTSITGAWGRVSDRAPPPLCCPRTSSSEAKLPRRCSEIAQEQALSTVTSKAGPSFLFIEPIEMLTVPALQIERSCTLWDVPSLT